MGQSRKRAGRDGGPRYTAYYVDIAGRRRSAGTFASKRDADRAWQRAESKVAEGRVGDLRRSRQRFGRYVADEWLPNHIMELTTRQSYTYQLNRRILPAFGDFPMVEILPSHIREWVTKLQQDGVGPPTIRYCMTVLSAIFTTALNDQVTFLHPCKGVRTPAVAKKSRRIVTPEQFEAILAQLPDPTTQLLVETAIESGLRWGELTELRRRDFEPTTRVLTVSRVAVELAGMRQHDGCRFVVKPYPKDDEWRQVSLSQHIAHQLVQHMAPLDGDGLLFTAPQATGQTRRRPDVLPDPSALGFTEPNDAGRRYAHGTITGYSAGGCRCRHCKDACALYRARRRDKGIDQPRKPRTLTTDGHIPRSWFRLRVWKPALAKAGLDIPVRFHDLRHAHASWLLAAGADLQIVKERMGHASITTTEKYLHTLPGADATAVAALDAIRRRTG
jgi:integrase